MLRALFSVLTVIVALAGCPGAGGIGDSCAGQDDCGSGLQCFNAQCAMRCTRAPQCGDGYSCALDGRCIAAHGQAGDACKSEVACEAGLACRINGAEVGSENRLLASCAAENSMSTRPAGDPCDVDDDCRNGTCEVGHCVDLCAADLDCPIGFNCVNIPRIAVNGTLFTGCLPEHGTLSWEIPVISSSAEILLPVPSSARSAELVMSVDDPSQEVGAAVVRDPCGCTRYQAPCPFGATPAGGMCSDVVANDQFFSQPVLGTGTGTGSGNTICSANPCSDIGNPPVNHVRHRPELGRSVLLMPSVPRLNEIKYGAYIIRVSSFWPTGAAGSAVPHVTAVVRLGVGGDIDLHFFFLDLADHPCSAMTGGATLDAAAAQQPGGYFQDGFLRELTAVFGRVGLAVSDKTYENLPRHPELSSIDLASVGSLLSLGSHATGVNVFFVRSLSPLGLQAFAPSPGSGVAGTPQSGIVISLDTLCYRDWQSVARLAAHEIARYMGLYHNVEPRDPGQLTGDPVWQDLIEDSDTSSDNLMYFSEPTGTTLSFGQRDALSWSPVIRWNPANPVMQ
jgi:hypothetical protein